MAIIKTKSIYNIKNIHLAHHSLPHLKP